MTQKNRRLGGIHGQMTSCSEAVEEQGRRDETMPESSPTILIGRPPPIDKAQSPSYWSDGAVRNELVGQRANSDNQICVMDSKNDIREYPYHVPLDQERPTVKTWRVPAAIV